jgi:hypothetical protein
MTHLGSEACIAAVRKRAMNLQPARANLSETLLRVAGGEDLQHPQQFALVGPRAGHLLAVNLAAFGSVQLFSCASNVCP